MDGLERRLADEMRRFADTPLPGRPPEEVLSGASRISSSYRPRRVAMTMVLAAAVAVGGGMAIVRLDILGALSTHRAPSGTGTSAAPQVFACSPEALVRQLRTGTFDYVPAETPAKLAARADLVAIGHIATLAQGRVTPLTRGETTTILNVSDVRVLAGNAASVAGGTVHMELPFVTDVTADLKDVSDCQVVMFLEDIGSAGELGLEDLPDGVRIFRPFVQGLWIGTDATVLGVYEDVAHNPPGWAHIQGIQDLIESIGAAPEQ
jgi:hypothetical protein